MLLATSFRRSLFFSLAALTLIVGMAPLFGGAVMPVNAVSRKTQGGSAFDLPINLTGPASIECRSGGTTGDYEIVITFPSAVTFSSASLTNGAGSVSGSSVNGEEVTVDLTGVGNGQTVAVTLFNVSDGVVANDVMVAMSILIGDTNGDGFVNVGDTLRVRAQSGNAASTSNFQDDLTADGYIDASDVSLVRAQAGTSLSNGTLTVGISDGSSQATTPGNFLPLPISVNVNSSIIYNGMVNFTVAQGNALLTTDNSGTQTPSTTLSVPVTYEPSDINGETISAQAYVYLPSTASGTSIIQVTASDGSQTASVSTTAIALDPSTPLPPTNFSAQATSSSSATLSWTPSTTSVPTTLQVSGDNGSTWYTIGVTAPGVSVATVSGMTPDEAVSFGAFSGGIYSPGGESDFLMVSLSGPPSPAPPSLRTVLNPLTPLTHPIVMGEQAIASLGKNGHKGFQVGTNYYLTETDFLSTEEKDDNGNWNFIGSTTTVWSYDPITGHQTLVSEEVVGQGGYEFGLFGGITETISDTFRQTIGTGTSGTRSSDYDTLSDYYTAAQLLTNCEALVPPFQNLFSPGVDWADIYFGDYAGSITKLQYQMLANQSQTPVIVWDETFTPFDSGGGWNPGANGENIQHNIRKWPVNGSGSGVYQIDPTQNGGPNGEDDVVIVQIELADQNQTGGGGMVPSLITDGTQQKHFVTPKQVGGTVQFRATLVDSSNDFGLLYEWTVPNGVTVSGDTVTVPRDTPNWYPIQLKVKGTSTIVDTLNVWVVWATGTIVNASNQMPGPGVSRQANVPTLDGTISAGLASKVFPFYRFKFSIQPPEIFTAADIPNLQGERDPAGDSQLGGTSSTTGDPLVGGAPFRWDVSRQAQYRILNPNLIPFEKLPSGYGNLYTGEPQNDLVTVPFPASAVIGNDDPLAGDEDNNPYAVSTRADREHDIGEIASADGPTLKISDAGGQEGYTYEEDDSFKEFARLEIGHTWYVVSDPFLWHATLKAKFQGGQWSDNGSETGTGN